MDMISSIAYINSSADELFVSIFHSFEAGIANTISASNDEKYLYF